MSSDDNKQLLQFLDFFCNLEKSPHYALMVKGAWGSGKTFIVKKFMDGWTTVEKPYLYVSLYGVSDTRQIDDALFSAMHPVLGSKAVKIGSRIFKGTLKAALKIDLDGDGKDDGTVNLQLPDFSLVETLSTNGYVLVFDDLERCSADIADVMGYINGFVEHGGQRVIIIANEDDFKESETSKESRYGKIKEKLIGKTFEVRPQISDALRSFVDDIPNGRSKDLLNEQFKYISDVYLQSETKNLRILRHSISDFARLYDALEKKYQDNKQAIKHILGLMLCLCFEMRSGNLKTTEISDLIANFRLFGRKNEDERQKQIRQIAQRYTLVDFNNGVISTESWIDIIDHSYIDKPKVENELDQCGYYKSSKLEEWRTLWHSISISQDEFDAALAAVLSKISEKYYNDRGVILHVSGLLIELSNNNLYSTSPSDVEAMMKNYITELVASGKVIDNRKDVSLRIDTGYQGLGFQGSESAQFRQIADHFEKEIKDFKISKYPEIAATLLDLMHTDPEDFLIKTCHTNSRENIYADVPIFASVDPKEYIRRVRSTSIGSQHQVFMAFKMRYDHKSLSRDLAPELPWVQNVQTEWNALTDTTALEANRLRIYLKNYVEGVGP